MAAALLAAAPFLLARRGSHYVPTLKHRLGLGAATAARPGGLWVHAVSVGEVGVAATLARGLPEDEPSLVTTVTPTGQERARSAFGDLSAVTYLPFDLGFAVRRLFRRHAPGALVLVEGDYWPLVLREADRRGMPVAVVNGRVGDGSFRRMRRLRRLLGPLFDRVDRFGVQTAEDRRRLLELGIDPERIEVTGNLKYDTPAPAPVPELEETVRALAAGRPVLVAGSTMEGEEELVLDAFAALRRDLPERASDGALLVLAPRHPERWDRVAETVRTAGLVLERRSERTDGARRAAEAQEHPDVLLLDTLGELAALYRMAAVAFIGGTLVPTGGHNPLEAALWGVPVAVGPSMENFRQVAEEFDRAGAWERVGIGRRGAEELADVWRRWLAEPDAARAVGARGRELVEANRGALERTLRLLGPILAAADREEDGGEPR